MLEQRVVEWTHKWKQEGIQQGVLKARKDILRRALEVRFGAVPGSVTDAIEELEDPAVLQELFDAAVRAESLEAFMRQMPRA